MWGLKKTHHHHLLVKNSTISPRVRYAVALRKILIPLSREWYILIKGGGKGHGRKALPLVSPWSTCFLLLLAQRIISDIFVGSKILTGNSPDGPPSCISRRHTMVVVFVGWSTALLSRVSVLFLREQTYNKVDNKYSTKLVLHVL